MTLAGIIYLYYKIVKLGKYIWEDSIERREEVPVVVVNNDNLNNLTSNVLRAIEKYKYDIIT